MTINKHELSRYIPEDIKYQIRKDAYFGCVHCGMILGQYEHIDPEFHEARTHDPSKMTFLCPNMNQQKQRGFLSNNDIIKWKSNPWCKDHGHGHLQFNIKNKLFTIWIGNNKFVNFENIITIDDICILSIKKPTELNSPLRLSGIFHDDCNNEILKIVDNEWLTNSSAYDVVCSNGKLVILKDKSIIAIKISFFPDKALVIEEINMNYNGLIIFYKDGIFTITGPKQGGVKIQGSNLFQPEMEGLSLFMFDSNKSGVKIGGGIKFSTHNEQSPTRPIQSMKCDRNKLCPCNSGKKYKKCCYPKYNIIL